jgi:phosphoribosylaminoimidazolecarboxamide formyltransferase/IMP cyclohydrolase
MTRRRALLSVSDKQNILEFARALHALDVEIISTGGTKSLLDAHGIPTTAVPDVTGFPEILDGRVKTLHPAIHAGLLAVRTDEAHHAQMTQLQLSTIDIVAVNLYPFAQTIAKPTVTWEEAVENIDIGGPSMLRSAAKNHRFVTVVVDAADYEQVLAEWRQYGDTLETTRKALAAKTFRHTAAYDAVIATYFSDHLAETMPERLTLTYEHVQTLRYGENPQQHAALYRDPLAPAGSLVHAQHVHGKALSYNNIQDTAAAWQLLREFTQRPAVVVVKHMNPCGVGIGETSEEAFIKAYEADPVSIFGGIVALNRVVDEATAMRMHDLFLEVIIAPGFAPAAVHVLSAKKNVRLLALPFLPASEAWMKVSIDGGMLVQQVDPVVSPSSSWHVVTTAQPTPSQWEALHFAWRVVKHVKSNAIVVATAERTLGIGAGQMNRVGAARLALDQAGEHARGAVLASDAFFPMEDTVALAQMYGIQAIIQPGGSIKDAQSIAKANETNIAMVFTGQRHFRH